MQQSCDLHTHSHYSDGTLAPAEIVTEAAALGLSAVALTDHNTVAGLPEFLAAARGGTVQAIPGVEISTEYGEVELHIVGLFLPPDCFDSVTSFLDDFNQKKAESNRQLIHALNRAGYDLNYEEICRRHPEGTVNRATIAAALLEKGYVSSINDAFKGLLSKKAGYYVPPQRLSSFDAIDFLRSVGAVPVLAHPVRMNLEWTALQALVNHLRECGLQGLEAFHSSANARTARQLDGLARQCGLLVTGGSDFHGDVGSTLHIGRLPAGWLQRESDLSALLQSTLYEPR